MDGNNVSWLEPVGEASPEEQLVQGDQLGRLARVLEQLPEKAVVVGGGYIAVEFAGILNGVGVETHLVYRGPQLLKSFDREMSAKVTEGMEAKGVNIHLNRQINEIVKTDNGLSLVLDNNSSLEAGLVLYATGRQANTAGLGLENTAAVRRDNGSIVVDDNF